MLDLAPLLVSTAATGHSALLWEECGLGELTGRPSGPPLPGPSAVVPAMQSLAAEFAMLSEQLGQRVEVDGPGLLVERSRITGHRRQGDVSVGGACRLVRARDGWVAVSLARDDDLAAVPAWLETDVSGSDHRRVDEAIATRAASWLVERAELLGIPCSVLGEVRDAALPAHRIGDALPRSSSTGLLVVDLSSLWAGPLCGRLLASAGMRVVKVESSRRPDGARLGPRQFFDLMNGGKEQLLLDLASPEGRDQLTELVAGADVVIEASRPRALEQMGIDASSFPGQVWLSITAYGRTQPARVGFGDDAAVAGGLVSFDEQGPVFAGDAIADPITGLLGAVAVLDRLVAGGRWLVDLSLAHAARLVSVS